MTRRDGGESSFTRFEDLGAEVAVGDLTGRSGLSQALSARVRARARVRSQTCQTQLRRRRPRLRPLKVSEYVALAELGAFDTERVEFLRGRVVRMAPQGEEHAWIVQTMTVSWSNISGVLQR